jgi:hypothetical protein
METRQYYDEMVKGPGKFECEPAFAPYYYEMWLAGNSDEDLYDGDALVSFFKVWPEDVEIFPELADVYGIALYESEQGFVYVIGHPTMDEYEANILLLESLESEECEG